MEVIWLYGASGTGKSWKARDIAGERDTYTKSFDTKFWGGYDAHEVVIIDSFSGSDWPITYLLDILDRCECPVDVTRGGGTRQFKPKCVIISSIKHPRDCYKLNDEDEIQLLRRIDQVICMESQVRVVSEEKSNNLHY